MYDYMTTMPGSLKQTKLKTKTKWCITTPKAYYTNVFSCTMRESLPVWQSRNWKIPSISPVT